MQLIYVVDDYVLRIRNMFHCLLNTQHIPEKVCTRNSDNIFPKIDCMCIDCKDSEEITQSEALVIVRPSRVKRRACAQATESFKHLQKLAGNLKAWIIYCT